MDCRELKALLMAIMAPNGTSINMNKDMMNKLEQNADEIGSRCFPPVALKEEKSPAPTPETRTAEDWEGCVEAELPKPTEGYGAS